MNFIIHHFLIDYNSPCLPPKTCITIVLDFSLDDCNTPEKLETMVMQNLGWGRGGGGGGGWGQLFDQSKSPQSET